MEILLFLVLGFLALGGAGSSGQGTRTYNFGDFTIVLGPSGSWQVLRVSGPGEPGLVAEGKESNQLSAQAAAEKAAHQIGKLPSG